MMNFVHGIRMERDGSGTTRNGAEKTTQNGAKKTTLNGAKKTTLNGAKEAMQRCGTVRLPDYRPLPADSGTNTQ
jgi:hypothetical protein